MKNLSILTLLLVSAFLLLAGCSQNPISKVSGDVTDDVEQEIAQLQMAARPIYGPAAPSPIVAVAVGENTLEFWPYTGMDYSGSPQDPVNLIFFGQADPRDIRAALLSLDGDRSAFGLPPMPPFNSVWDDALGGDIQDGFGGPDGWVPGAIQLACGDYEPLRIHMRLFKMGNWTVANAHFETIIPGTSNHQVLSWELAEEFVLLDFMRSGLLDPEIPMIPAGAINNSPFRTIPAIIYNGLPVELRQLIGGPLGDVSEDVPIATNGEAYILNLAQTVPRVAETRAQNHVINFGQVIPKPFCSSGPYDYVHVAGPVYLTQTTSLTADGFYSCEFQASGTIKVTSVDPTTGEFLGKPLTALIRQQDKSHFGIGREMAWSYQYQRLGPFTQEGSGRLFKLFKAQVGGPYIYNEDIICHSDQFAEQD